MDNEHELLYFKMLLLQAQIELEAMKASNIQSAMRREKLKYTEEDFMGLIEKHGIHHNNFPFYKG
jgi:hypothetical protein